MTGVQTCALPISGSAPNLTYTPSNNFTGGVSFTFNINDGSLTSSVATVTITITNVNDAPVVGNDTYTVIKNNTLTVPVSGVLTNDSDPDGDVLTAVLVTGPAHAAVFNLNANGSFTYTPSNNYVGPDSFTYQANDGTATSGVATASITVLATNTAPVVTNQSVTIPEDTATNLVMNATDIDANPLTFIIVIGPTNGVLSNVNTNTGTFTYRPNTNFAGGDSFTFRVNDGLTNSGLATYGITILPVNDAPVANNLNVITPEDTSTNLVLTATDPDNTNLVFAILNGPTNGSLGVLNTNTGTVTYSPTANYHGPDTFTFTVFDGTLFATGTVFITVTPVNDAPVAFSQNLTNAEDTALPITLTGADVDGPVTNFTVLTQPLFGTLTGTAPNLTYTPSNNFTGVVSFTFNVNDGSLTSATATVTITITNVNDAPVATNLVVVTPQNTATNLVLLGSDVEGPVIFAILVAPTNGVVSGLNPNTGAVTYTPTNNYSGPDSFRFTVSDGSLLATGTVTITVTPLIVAQADVALSKTGPATGGAGSNLTYTITVTNHGPFTATNVLVQDQLPAGMTYVSSLPATATVLNKLVSWPLFNLATGVVSSFTVTARAAEGGTYTNIAFSTATTSDPNPTNNNGSITNSQVATVVTPGADVAVFKTGSNSVLAAGSLTYTITATNSGPSTATNVIVRDTSVGRNLRERVGWLYLEQWRGQVDGDHPLERCLRQLYDHLDRTGWWHLDEHCFEHRQHP